MNKTFTTEKGIAYYPYISAPDTKFDEQGHYKVNLCLSQEKAKLIIHSKRQGTVLVADVRLTYRSGLFP